MSFLAVNRQVKTNGKYASLFVYLIVFILSVLFLYTALDKFQTIQKFTDIMGRIYLPAFLVPIVAWGIPIVEVIIVTALLLPKFRHWGLLASAILLAIFTIYITVLKLTGLKLPCNCGGIISSLSWWNHIILNTVLLIAASIAYKIEAKRGY
ncbi:MauE/DoxX family redox-associated membrane protein [Chitinophaga horti]|uniref:MauE/DoxX family redox-associated membrane protein n=1 Tax=Chitinophaga horti TaxID=2920382 RepID=UPI003D81BC52